MAPQTQTIDSVKLQNIHPSVTQHVTEGDRRWSLPPLMVQTFPKKIAKVFLSERGKYVRKYDSVDAYSVQGEPMVWLANNTGNPFEPKEIERPSYSKGKEIFEKIDNPLRTPRHLRWKLHTGQSFTQGETAIGFQDISINSCPTQFELVPFERKPFAESFADRALQRDAFHEQGMQRSIVTCREPQPFEPNESWTLDEVRLYAILVDAEGIGAVTNGGVPTEASFKGDQEGIDAAKQTLLQVLFFRIIDDAWVLPTQLEFQQEAAKAKVSGQGQGVGSGAARR